MSTYSFTTTGSIPTPGWVGWPSFHYFSPLTPGAASFDVDVSNLVRLGSLTGLDVEAEMGATGNGNVVLDDVNSTAGYLSDGIVGLKQFYINELGCPAGNQRLWTGYVGDRRYYRGQGDSLIMGAARKIDITLVDLNDFLNFRVFAPVASDPTSSFDRPAESDIERITALLNNVDFLSTTLFDIGYVNSAGSVQMDKNDYTGSTPSQVLNDAAQASKKNFFVLYDEATNKVVLWYDFIISDGSTTKVFDSTLSLTNVNSEQNESTVFAIAPDAVAVLDPSRVVSADYVPYTGGTAYRKLLSTANTFAWRDSVSPSVYVKTLAKANAIADSNLAENSTEDERISCTVRIPSNKVTLIKAGQRIQCHFTHLPNVASAMTWCRILKLKVRQDQETSFYYWLDLELTPIPSSSSFLIAFGAQGFATQPTDLSTNPWTSKAYTGDFTTFSVIACGAGPPANEGGQAWARLIVPSESATVATIKNAANSSGGTHIYQVGGVDLATVMAGLTAATSNAFVADGGTASITATASTQSVLYGMILGGKVNYDGGWCTGWGPSGPLVTTTAGTELVNKSSYNDCTGATPWVWIGYVVGTGTLTLSAVFNAHGGGSGAYACGYNVGKASLLIPLSGSHSIVRSGFGYDPGSGGTYTVILPAAP